MKKVISLVLAMLMALSLVACGGSNDATTDDVDPNAGWTPTKTINIYMTTAPAAIPTTWAVSWPPRWRRSWACPWS